MKLIKKYMLFSLLIGCTKIHAMNDFITDVTRKNNATTMRKLFECSDISSRIIDFLGGNPDGSPVTQGSITGINSDGSAITQDIKVAENFDGTPVYKKVLKRIIPICILEQKLIIDLIIEDQEKESTTTFSPIRIVDQEPVCDVIADASHCDTDYDRIKNVCRIVDLYAFLFPQIPKNLCTEILQKINKRTTWYSPDHRESPQKNSCNDSLLRKSINLKNYKLTKLLLKYGANSNEMLDVTPDDTRTILFRAAEMFDEQSIKLLVDHGADRTIKDWHGYTALGYAIHNIPIDVENSNLQFLEPLLTNNANLDDRDTCGNTLLDLAIIRSNSTIIKTLLAHGANPNAQRKNGWTPLHLAIFYSKTNLTKILVEHGVNLNIQDEDGWTPLHHAFHRQDKESVELLIAHRANQDIKDNNGKFPRDIPINPFYLPKPAPIKKSSCSIM